WWPCLARWRAACRPMPVVAPVTRMICFAMVLYLSLRSECSFRSWRHLSRDRRRTLRGVRRLSTNGLPHAGFGGFHRRLQGAEAHLGGAHHAHEGAPDDGHQHLGRVRLDDLLLLGVLDEQLERGQRLALDPPAGLVEVVVVVVQLEEGQDVRVLPG